MTKPGRNDPCPCGSGKKHKKCCLGKISDVDLGAIAPILPDPIEEQGEEVNISDLLEMSQTEILNLTLLNDIQRIRVQKEYQNLVRRNKKVVFAYEPEFDYIILQITSSQDVDLTIKLEHSGEISMQSHMLRNFSLALLLLKDLLSKADPTWPKTAPFIRNVLLSKFYPDPKGSNSGVFVKEVILFSPLVNSIVATPKFRPHVVNLAPFRLEWNADDLELTQFITMFAYEFLDHLGGPYGDFDTAFETSFTKLLFRFSDQTELFLNELFCHPYIALLPPKTLPATARDLTLTQVTQDLFCFGKRGWRHPGSEGHFHSGFLDETQVFMLRFIENLVNAPHAPNLFMASEPTMEANKYGKPYIYDMTPKRLYDCFQVCKFHSIPDDAYELKIRPPHLIFSIKQPFRIKNDRKLQFFSLLENQIIYLPDSRQVVFTKMGSMFYYFTRFTPDFSFMESNDPTNEFILKAPTSGNDIVRQSETRQTLNRIFEDATEYFNLTPVFEGESLLKVAISEVGIELVSVGDADDEVACNFHEFYEMPGQAIPQINDFRPAAFQRFLATLCEGLGRWFYGENTKLAVKSNQEKRKNELLLYRHQALAAFIWVIVGELEKEHGGNLSDLSMEDFTKLMLVRLAPVMNQLINWEREALDPKSELAHFRTQVSKKFVSNLKSFLETMYDYLFEERAENDLLVFFSKSQWGLVDSWPTYKQVLPFIADAMLAGLKPGAKPLARMKHISIDYYNFEISGTTVFQTALKHFYKPPFKLFLNGAPLKYQAAHELQVQMNLSELSTDEKDEGIDWFELNPSIFFNGQELTLRESGAIQMGKPFLFRGTYYLIDRSTTSPLSWLTFFWERLQDGLARKQSRSRSRIVELPRSQYLDLLALKALGIRVIGPPRWREIEARFEKVCLRAEGFDPEETKLLQKLDIPLHPFQKTGVLWMRNLYLLGLGGILADDMGLGKTVQTIGFLKSLYQENRLETCLIVVPTSLVYNWCSEFKKFASDLPIFVFDPKTSPQKPPKKPFILVCTYGLLARHQPFLESIAWNIAVFDEAQTLKNIKAQRTGAARKIKAMGKFCLSGTPMENHYGEYFSLIDLAVPGALGDYNAFMSTYSLKGPNPASPKDIEFLKKKTAPLVLRRMKKEILDQLPEKVESVIYLDLEHEQARIYRDIATSWNDRVLAVIDDKGEAKSQLIMLTALLRLRQVCSCPSIVPAVEYAKQPPKLELLLEELETLVSEGESAIVFTNFKRTLDHFRDFLLKHHIPVLCISGDMPQKGRVAVLKAFEESGSPQILLMTLKTGGLGLNLTKASYVFHLEPWWNPQAESQGTDRVHRLGQKKSVNVYRFIMRETVEEKIQTLKGMKQKAFDDLFEETKKLETEKDIQNLEKASTFAHTGLTGQDFKYLLSK